MAGEAAAAAAALLVLAVTAAAAAAEEPRLSAALAERLCHRLIQEEGRAGGAARTVHGCSQRLLARGSSLEYSVCRGADGAVALVPAEDGEGRGAWAAALVSADDQQTGAGEAVEIRSGARGEVLRWSGRVAGRGAAGVWAARGAAAAWRPVRPRAPEPLPVTRAGLPTAPAHYSYSDEDGLAAELSWAQTEDDNCDYVAYCTCAAEDGAADEAAGPEPPLEVSAGEPRALLAAHLPYAARCELTVLSLLGERSAAAAFPFTTPACAALRPPHLCPPERPRGVWTEARAAGGRGWRVLVGWEPPPPAAAPLYYRVLVANDSGAAPALALTVPGNATQAVVADARLTGAYQVRVVAGTAAGERQSAVVRAPAPRAAPAPRPAPHAAWAGAAAGAALLAAAGALFRRARLRRRDIVFEQSRLAEVKGGRARAAAGAAGKAQAAEDPLLVRPERLRLLEVVGEGQFGVVRRALLAPHNTHVAVKMLRGDAGEERARQLGQELAVMRRVGRHAHVVSLLGHVGGARPMLVVEYCARGDLLTYLRRAWQARSAGGAGGEGALSAAELLSVCRQAARGMEHLAACRVVHRDIAARNVLVCADRSVKIADFGLSRDVYGSSEYRRAGSGLLPLKWMALESLTHQIYTTQSDVWSFGVLMWETVTLGGVPYAEVSSQRLALVLAAGYRMPRPPHCAPEIYAVMRACWAARPTDRPSFSSLHARLDELLAAAAPDTYLRLDPPAACAADYWRLLHSEGAPAPTEPPPAPPFRTPLLNDYSSTPHLAPSSPVSLAPPPSPPSSHHHTLP